MIKSIGISIILGCVLVFFMCSNSWCKDIDSYDEGNIIYQESKKSEIKVNSFKGQKVVMKEIMVQVNDMIISNELPMNVEKYKINYFDEMCSEDGTLEDGYQYVFLDLTLENMSGAQKEVYLNSMRIAHLDENNRFIEPTEEMRYRTGYDFVGMCPKDYFRLALEKDEIVNVTVGFIVEDNFFEIQNSCLRINFGGNFYCTEIKSIRLDG